jgi:uncharacterized protein
MNQTLSDIVEKTIIFSRQKMISLRASHGWDHVQRVVNLAERISRTEPGSDPLIVKMAALLHDIARSDEAHSGGSVCHAELGSKMAYDFLITSGLGSDPADHVARCILTHRFRKNLVPESIEAKILYDADKLDSIGAVGIGRAFLFSGEVGATLHDPDADHENTRAYSEEDTAFREYTVKLRFVKDRMLTAEGKKIAEERDRFMELFFRRIDDEVRGRL